MFTHFCTPWCPALALQVLQALVLTPVLRGSLAKMLTGNFGEPHVGCHMLPGKRGGGGLSGFLISLMIECKNRKLEDNFI